MKFIDPVLEAYCEKHTTPFPPLFQRLREETWRHTEIPQMQVEVLEGSFLQMLVRLLNAKTILEIGTFTGWSAMAMAEAMPEDGRLYTCDLDPRHTDVAERFWKESPHGNKIELRLGPALETIPSLPDGLDMVFIDADKNNYPAYWKMCLPKVRKGGLLVLDNMLWSGRVLTPEDERDRALVETAQMVIREPKVVCGMWPIRDGILVAQKID